MRSAQRLRQAPISHNINVWPPRNKSSKVSVARAELSIVKTLFKEKEDRAHQGDAYSGSFQKQRCTHSRCPCRPIPWPRPSKPGCLRPEAWTSTCTSPLRVSQRSHSPEQAVPVGFTDFSDLALGYFYFSQSEFFFFPLLLEVTDQACLL